MPANTDRGRAGGVAVADLAHRALEAARVGTWEWDVASGRVTWPEETEAIFGIAPGSFAGTFDGFLTLVHDEDRAAVTEALAVAARDGRDQYEIEHRVLWPDGSVRWVEGRGRLFRGAAGTLERMAGIVVDATPPSRS